jgi:hypothetical protein
VTDVNNFFSVSSSRLVGSVRRWPICRAATTGICRAMKLTVRSHGSGGSNAAPATRTPLSLSFPTKCMSSHCALACDPLPNLAILPQRGRIFLSRAAAAAAAGASAPIPSAPSLPVVAQTFPPIFCTLSIYRPLPISHRCTLIFQPPLPWPPMLCCCLFFPFFFLLALLLEAGVAGAYLLRDGEPRGALVLSVLFNGRGAHFAVAFSAMLSKWQVGE